MRAATIFGLTAILLAAGCPSNEEDVEVCDDGEDNDGDTFTDCDDSECAADAACEDTQAEDEDCDDGDDNDGDGDVDCDDSDCSSDDACEEPSGPETDCRDGSDNDDDGDADCADSDCVDTEECRIMSWSETGTATVVPGATYVGTADWTFTFTTPEDGGEICNFEFDATSVSNDLADCSGCDFAFTVELTNGRTTSGDCTPIADGFGLTEGAGGSDFQYGYGYDADYEYNGSTFPVFMYNTYSYGWIAWPYTVAASFDGTTFDYEVLWGYYYYE